VLLKGVQDRGAAKVVCSVRDDRPRNIRFLATLGLSPTGRATCLSALAVARARLPRCRAVPRQVAGGPLTENILKCQLKPLRASDYYPITFSATEWTELQQIFPGGVCDWSKPGVDQRPTIPWLTYQNARGKVIHGGRPLGKPPTSKVIKARR